MRRLLLISSLSLLAFAPSCVLVQDVDQFEQDERCDVDLRIVDFFPHSIAVDDSLDPSEVPNFDPATRQVTQLRVMRVEDTTASPLRLRQEVVAYFDPLPDPNTRVFLPGAVSPKADVLEGAATLEIWADRDRSGIFMPTDEDHTYQLGRACDVEGGEFVHNTDFAQLAVPDVSFDRTLRINPPTGLGRANWFDVAIEVKVLSETSSGVQAHSFYRRERFGEPPPIAEIPEAAPFDIPRAFPDDRDVRVVIIADVNLNGELDGEETFAEAVIRVETPPAPCDDTDLIERGVCVRENQTNELGETVDVYEIFPVFARRAAPVDAALDEAWWSVTPTE